MPEPDPKPTPEPIKIDLSKWLPTIGVFAIAGLMAYQQWRGPVVPTPGPTITTPVVKPVLPPGPTPDDVQPGREFVLDKDGNVLDDKDAAPLISAFKRGEGRFTYHGYHPRGLIIRTMTIGGGPAPVVPPVVTPDTPKPDTPVVDPNTKPTAATYVYEKDQGGVPSAVMSGLNRLNREKKILATVFERDSTDGAGSVPEQYKVALAEANKAGLPALIVTNGATVLKVVKAPKTEAEIVEAAN